LPRLMGKFLLKLFFKCLHLSKLTPVLVGTKAERTYNHHQHGESDWMRIETHRLSQVRSKTSSKETGPLGPVHWVRSLRNDDVILGQMVAMVNMGRKQELPSSDDGCRGLL
jgi:hypothetical protein